MHKTRRSEGGLARALYLVVATGILVGAGAIAGCGGVETTPIPTTPPPDDLHPAVVGRNIDQIDLLLMIDNARSMGDKQQILAFTVPDLVRTLMNPLCVDSTDLPTPTQPTDPLSPCPPGAHREHTPVTDIHVGIITSSLGGHGADSCSVGGSGAFCSGSGDPPDNDAGHLITRQGVCTGKTIPTYEDKGFLAWDPSQRLSPPGEAQAGSIAVSAGGSTTTTSPGLIPTLKDLVVGVGSVGCGFTSQLESWYRFLVDPEPYQSISVVNGKATPQGIDTELLKERADFLRPASLLAIVMLTDTNDCSIKEYGQFYYAAQQTALTKPGGNFHLPRARKECATNPEDPCCKSCAQEAPGCPVDDACVASPTLSEGEDNINLRCFDQKRRFGIDFLYGIDRYQGALQSKMIPNHQGDLVPNPIFSDLNPTDDDDRVRNKSLVFLAGIVGVPWQDIARDPADPAKGVLDSEELRMVDDLGHTTWDKILGDPAHHVPPKDAHMIESVAPRPGLPGPASAPDADPINGHERPIAGDDLQYACIFDLPAPRDCSVQGVPGCDCTAASDNPLCDPVTPTLQVRAKAYPALRQLATLKSVASQGVLASLCPVQLTDTTRPDYGYRTAIRSIEDRLKTSISGTCFPRALTPDAQGRVSCTILQARKVSQACTCDGAHGRRDVPAEDQAFLDRVKASSSAKENEVNCFCELVQAGDPVVSTPQDLAACVGDPSEVPIVQGGKDDGAPAKGWCYVDPTQSSASNPEIVKYCPETNKRIIRYTGDALTGTESVLYMSCAAP